MLAAEILVSPAPLPINTLPVMLPVALIAPDVFTAVRMPTLVIFGCAAVVTVPAEVAAFDVRA